MTRRTTDRMDQAARDASNTVPLVDLTRRESDAPVTERADAARNRARVLTAAKRLFAENDPRTVTMDDIARAAEVGRATLYRRYPDPASIAVALLDEHERDLQGRIMHGPPPLGPGADPAERLAAFYEAMVDLLDEHLNLTLGAETGSLRYTTGAYGFWRAHVHALLDEAGNVDPAPLADVLLAPLAPEAYEHLRGQGVAKERVKRTLVELTASVSPRGGR